MWGLVCNAIDSNDVGRLSSLLSNEGYATDALGYACKNGKLESVKWFVEVKCVTETLELIYAVSSSHYDIVQYLITKGRNPNVSTSQWFTPLHYSGCPRITELLIQAGANINARTKVGDTSLSIAIRGCKRAIALTLLQYGARFDYAPDNFIPSWATKLRDDVLESKKAYSRATVAVMIAMRKRGAPKDMCAWFGATYMKQHQTGDDWLK